MHWLQTFFFVFSTTKGCAGCSTRWERWFARCLQTLCSVQLPDRQWNVHRAQPQSFSLYQRSCLASFWPSTGWKTWFTSVPVASERSWAASRSERVPVKGFTVHCGHPHAARCTLHAAGGVLVVGVQGGSLEWWGRAVSCAWPVAEINKPAPDNTKKGQGWASSCVQC